MKKSRSYGKILLVCMAVSYLQLAGSVGLAFAEDIPVPVELQTVDDAVVVPVEPEVIQDAILVESEDLEDEPVLPTVLELEIVLPQPEVEILVVDGVLSYELVNSEDYKGFDPVIFDSSWYLVEEELNLCPVLEEENILGSDVNYTPLATGEYGVNVVVSLVEENIEVASSEIGCVSLPVEFPTFDDVQFENLSYRAGEAFSFEYADEFDFVELTAVSGEESFTVTSSENIWIIEGSELTVDGDFELIFMATSEDGFQTSYVAQYSVNTGVISSVRSALSVVMNEEEVEYVEAGSGELDITFTAYDSYQNEIDINSLDSVKVYLSGNLLSGIDSVGLDQYVVERVAEVPDEENLNTEVVVDVFSEECEGVLAGKENYCFSKVKTIVVYETTVSPISDLEYAERTSDGHVIISGAKITGYGIKVNSVGMEYVVEPNELTTFSFEMPLAEGLNAVEIYAVKVVSEDLVFYSEPTVVTITKDSSVSAPVWRDTAITLDGNNQATLHWIDPIYLTDTDYDFTHVNIYRSTVPNFVPSEDNLVVQTHNPSWTDSGLMAGVAYYYTIEAVDDLGNTAMINTVESTGDIQGEAASVASEQVWYEDLFAGKGVYDDEEASVDEDGVVGLTGDEHSEEESEGFADRMSDLFNKAKTGASSFASKLFNNIFVQIVCGGVVIFLGLMILISVLVWLKERFVISSLSLDEVDSAIEKGKKSKSSKSKSTKKTSKKRASKSKKAVRKAKKK